MSADNGYVIRRNSAGQYVLQMFWMSADEYPPIDSRNVEKFNTLDEALEKYARGHDSDYWSEYGLYLETNQITHTKQEEESMSIETAKYVRKPFEVEAVQVTIENIDLVARWCRGKLVGLTPAGPDNETYIEVKVHRPQTLRHTKAFVGDWVLFAGKGYKVYTAHAFENSFTRVDEQGRLQRGADQVREFVGKVNEALQNVAEPAKDDEPVELLTTTEPAVPSPLAMPKHKPQG